MDIKGKTVWQIAAGNTNRDFVKICLEWGVILNGPGKYGPFPAGLKENVTAKKYRELERFCHEIKESDIVVLRLGTSEVYGIGEVVSGYEWNSNFGDIDGWNIQHVRRVRWLKKFYPEPKTFGNFSMKMGDTTQKLTKQEILDFIAALDVPEAAYQTPIKDLPPSQDIALDPQKTQQEIMDYLYQRGIASQSIDRLDSAWSELARIARWYSEDPSSGEYTHDKVNLPSEFETVSYLVVPLLHALGWSHQRAAVEWFNIDMALFSTMPRSKENLSTIVEVKRLEDACLTAFEQAKGYSPDCKNCNRLIVTDGIRYGVYLKKDNEFQLSSYLNLLNPLPSYPILECAGAHQALMQMAPEST